MKSKILAILAILLVTLSSGTSAAVNDTEAILAVGTITIDQPSLTFGTDGLVHEVQETDGFNLVYSGGDDVTVTLSYVPENGDESMTVALSQTTATLTDATRNVPITVTAKASRDQYISLNNDVRFGGKVIAKVVGSEIASVPIRAAVSSDLVDIEVDDSDFDDTVEPGDSLSINVEVRNRSGKENMQFDDAELSVIDFDDGSDLDVDPSDDFADLDEGDSDDQDFDLDVPYNVDEGSFDLRLKLKFDADELDTFTIYGIWNEAIDVDKEESRDVHFSRFEVNQENPACGAVLNVETEVVNTGSKDLDNVKLTLSIDDAELSQNSQIFDLDSDKYDDREQSASFSLRLPNDLEGDQVLRLRAYYENTVFVEETTRDISVRCTETSDDEDTSSDDNDNSNSDNDNDQEDNDGVTGGSTVYTPTSPFGSLFGSGNAGTVIFWVIVDLILLLIAIWLLRVIFRRRKND